MLPRLPAEHPHIYHNGKELVGITQWSVATSIPRQTKLTLWQVDFVASGSRFKLYLPKENTKITFVLAGQSRFSVSSKLATMCCLFLFIGIRAPRTARNANEKSEPFGQESLKFASRYMQRDVEIGEL